MGKVWDWLAGKTYLFWALRGIAEFSDSKPVVILASQNPCINIPCVLFGRQAPWNHRKAELANKVDDSGRGCVVLGTWLNCERYSGAAPCSIRRQGGIRNGLMAHSDMPHRAWCVSWVASRKSNPQRGTGSILRRARWPASVRDPRDSARSFRRD